MSRQTKGGVKEKVAEKTKTKEPRLWKVLLLNDDVTPIEFVFNVMMEVFGKSRVEAKALTLEIHHGTSGVLGIYPKSIAEAKKMQADAMSMAKNYPLAVKLERE
ncbi:MAG: ATP-dependent Clp protease adaptor ClpS [Victivallales bacterium]|jgi:ATP-dependent Clp protease adaptor protein ClpS